MREIQERERGIRERDSREREIWQRERKNTYLLFSFSFYIYFIYLYINHLFQVLISKKLSPNFPHSCHSFRHVGLFSSVIMCR